MYQKNGVVDEWSFLSAELYTHFPYFLQIQLWSELKIDFTHICNSGIDTKIRMLKIIVCMFFCGITVSMIYCINLGDIRLMISDKIQKPNAITAYFNVDFFYNPF